MVCIVLSAIFSVALPVVDVDVLQTGQQQLHQTAQSDICGGSK